MKLKFVLYLLLLFLMLDASAQTTFNDDVDDAGNDEEVPLNHLIGLLILAGLWFGQKSIKEKS